MYTKLLSYFSRAPALTIKIMLKEKFKFKTLKLKHKEHP